MPDTILNDRDPMLAAAVEAHGAEWRPDLHEKLELPMVEGMGLPYLLLRTLEHHMRWKTPTGLLVRRNQHWNARNETWVATATISDIMPDTILHAMAGKTLEAVVDLPGANAWRITSIARMPGISLDMQLKRC